MHRTIDTQSGIKVNNKNQLDLMNKSVNTVAAKPKNIGKQEDQKSAVPFFMSRNSKAYVLSTPRTQLSGEFSNPTIAYPSGYQTVMNKDGKSINNESYINMQNQTSTAFNTIISQRTARGMALLNKEESPNRRNLSSFKTESQG